MAGGKEDFQKLTRTDQNFLVIDSAKEIGKSSLGFSTASNWIDAAKRAGW